MNAILFIAVDLLAMPILVPLTYYRRHRRRDLNLSYMTVNIGVLAVAATLSLSSASVGLGLGLFGILSIIRLRSDELSHHEIAYYFGALSIGLISGVNMSLGTVSPVAFIAALLAVIIVSDFHLNQTGVETRPLRLIRPSALLKNLKLRGVNAWQLVWRS